MTRNCPYCEDVILAERFDDHLSDCMRHIPPPPPPGRYLVSCSRKDCLLHKGASYSDIGNAELLAFAHEQRHPVDYRDNQELCHYVDVKDLDAVQPSLKPEAATGVKEAAHG